MDKKNNIKCPKCGTKYVKGKQFCQGKGCTFNITWWIRTGTEYVEKKANLPFTKGF